MDQTPGAAVRAAVDQALAMGDPAERAFAITEILAVIQDRQGELKGARQADVRTLRETLTLEEVGERIGVSTGRVSHIMTGRT
ncbi:sigma factor-like helix-turn-helix DNA-binding protein [Streptomyces sp. NPDC059009]|uniref:sigma factor-like helix-turn-helix DNA-binding protein n=1 Tax=Streptomyces sp. NPDC059009 TaxID=3346694 RepID=UPI00369BC789